MTSTLQELRAQLGNPGDILSLLLLLGGDIVQKAIAQLVGQSVRIPGRSGLRLSIVPVAFSFGWAAYSLNNLLEVFGNMRLMPIADQPSITVNCANGFIRETRSWVLGRLLRDHEIRFPIDTRPTEDGGRAESIRVDIFNLGPISAPSFDFVWWSGCGTLVLQIGIAIIPYVLYKDWGALLITLSGVVLIAANCALPQWIDEKWAGRKLERQKVTCVTRGNGHRHIMVFIAYPGSWDLESLATGIYPLRPETYVLSVLLAVAWTCLLIIISGLKQHTWFLVGIGGLGMLHNVFAAGTMRDPSASNFHLTEFPRAATIIGQRDGNQKLAQTSDDDDEKLVSLDIWSATKVVDQPQAPRPQASDPPQMPAWLETMSQRDNVPEWLEALQPSNYTETSGEPGVIYAPGGVHGALIELEKWVPTAGLAMAQVFFPGGLTYNDAAIRDDINKQFWTKAYNTVSTRRRAVEKKRAEVR